MVQLKYQRFLQYYSHIRIFIIVKKYKYNDISTAITYYNNYIISSDIGIKSN